MTCFMPVFRAECMCQDEIGLSTDRVARGLLPIGEQADCRRVQNATRNPLVVFLPPPMLQLAPLMDEGLVAVEGVVP